MSPAVWCHEYRALLDLSIYGLLDLGLMEKWVKVLHSESEWSWLKSRLPVTWGSKKVLNTVINIRLIALPLDSGSKLAVGQ